MGGGGGAPAFFCQSFTEFACSYASFLKRGVGTAGKAPSWVEGWTNDWHLLHWLWWLSCWWRQWWLRRRYSNDDVWSKRWLWSWYHEDESITFFKQVKRTLNFKLEIRVSQEPCGAQGNLFPRFLLGTSRRGACERAGGLKGPKDGRAERKIRVNFSVKYLE